MSTRNLQNRWQEVVPVADGAKYFPYVFEKWDFTVFKRSALFTQCFLLLLVPVSLILWKIHAGVRLVG